MWHATFNAVSQQIILNTIHDGISVDKQDWSDDELDSILKTYDLEVPTASMEYKENSNNNMNKPKLTNTDSGGMSKFNKFKSLKMLQDYSKSLPGHIEKGMSKIKSVSTNNVMGNNKVPIKPYGGHVEASQTAIEEEFGSIQEHIKEYNVKKRNKLGRDKNRKAVVDIPLQVLRIKDTTGKTHKEHIVSSISDHALVGHEQSATQIIVEYFLNYFNPNKHQKTCKTNMT